MINSPFLPAADSYLGLIPGVLEGYFGSVPAIHQYRLTEGMALPPTMRAYTDPPDMFDGADGWTVFFVARLNEAPVGSGRIADGKVERLFGSRDGQLALGVASEDGAYYAKVKYGSVEKSLLMPTMIGRPLIFTVMFDPQSGQLSLAEIYSGRTQVTINNPLTCSGLEILKPADQANAAGAYAADKDFFELLSFCSALDPAGVQGDVAYLQERYDLIDPPALGMTSLNIAVTPEWIENLNVLVPQLPGGGTSCVRVTIDNVARTNPTAVLNTIHAYAASGLVVYVLFPPEFLGRDQRAWSAQWDPETISNQFNRDFALAAADFASACQADCQNFIIWNEFNAPPTCFTRVFPANGVPPDTELRSAWNAEHFVALIWECWQRFSAQVPGASVHLGGVQMPSQSAPRRFQGPGDDDPELAETLLYLGNVYAAWEAIKPTSAPPRPWGGINVHIHEYRDVSSPGTPGWARRAQDEIAYMSDLFRRIRELIAADPYFDQESTVVVGETGVSIEFESNDARARDDMSLLLYGIYHSVPEFPDVMFYFSHQANTDANDFSWGLMNYNIDGQPARPTGGTDLYVPYVRTLNLLRTGQPDTG